MTLKAWIEKTGPKKIAQKLGVEQATVSAWKRGLALPRAHQIVYIHRMSRGRVSYEEIVKTAARATLRGEK